MVDAQTLLLPPLSLTLLPVTVSSTLPSLLISDMQPTSLPLSHSVSSFTQLVGITSSLPSKPMDVDFLEVFLTPSIIEHIVKQTNFCVSKVRLHKAGWCVHLIEYIHFLGLVIAMGVKLA